MKKFSTITAFMAVFVGFAAYSVFAAAQPIPGVDISAKKNPGGVRSKPTSIAPGDSGKGEESLEPPPCVSEENPCPVGCNCRATVPSATDQSSKILPTGTPGGRPVRPSLMVGGAAGDKTVKDSDGSSTNRLLPTVNKKTVAVSDDTSANQPGIAIDEGGTPKVKKPSTKANPSGGTTTGDAKGGKQKADSLATP